ncbi:hypothetical protein [Streptomyces galbus]|uniref:hypothetical protein n=1 Tax=Streptomyces galbus TaxID=33898 RepID=UPI003EBF71B4
MPRRAVVIGAGLAGMLAAAALAGAADEVVVLDGDALPDGPDHRKGLPQGRHAHILMAGGLTAMEELVPGAGVRKRLLAAGAHELSLGRDMVALTPEGWFRRWRHEGPAVLACTRALLQPQGVGERLGIDVGAGPNLRTRSGTDPGPGCPRWRDERRNCSAGRAG